MTIGKKANEKLARAWSESIGGDRRKKKGV
jgi:hypothetical protein